MRFSEKHGPDAKPDERIRDEILKHMKNDGLSCALAFKIAKNFDVPPAEVGKNLDLMNLKLLKCQLGLFGYHPEKRIIKSREDMAQDVKDAIQNRLVNDRIPCQSVWEIAAQFQVSKMTVSGACEAMNIKIKPCQLGAF